MRKSVPVKQLAYLLRPDHSLRVSDFLPPCCLASSSCECVPIREAFEPRSAALAGNAAFRIGAGRTREGLGTRFSLLWREASIAFVCTSAAGHALSGDGDEAVVILGALAGAAAGLAIGVAEKRRQSAAQQAEAPHDDSSQPAPAQPSAEPRQEPASQQIEQPMEQSM